MLTKQVQSHKGISVGDQVEYQPEDGFHAGVPVRKVVASIFVTEWTMEESKRLQVPMIERLIKFQDGSTAGEYDVVRKL